MQTQGNIIMFFIEIKTAVHQSYFPLKCLLDTSLGKQALEYCIFLTNQQFNNTRNL